VLDAFALARNQARRLSYAILRMKNLSGPDLFSLIRFHDVTSKYRILLRVDATSDRGPF
jgi:hypothetical protein